MEKIEKILKEIRPDIDVNNQNLIEEGFLDSFDIVTLVSELISEFEIELSVEDILPENFHSVEAIYQLVQSKRS